MATVRFSIKPHWLTDSSADERHNGTAAYTAAAMEKDESKVKVPKDIEHRQKWKRALVDLLEVIIIERYEEQQYNNFFVISLP